MHPRIIVAANPLHDLDVMLELAPPDFDIAVAPSGSTELLSALAEAEFLVGMADTPMDHAFYRRAPRLRLVQLLSAGYDRIDIEAARRAKVPVCNNGGANAVAVSEHALLLMLAVSRRLHWLHANVLAGRWRGNDVASLRLYELSGRTLGIVGLGTIGKKTARLARAFGMIVQYYDIVRLTEDQADTLGVRFRLLGELLRTSDFVSLHVPFTRETKHMIGADELSLMKRTAYLINTCRGPVVDECALHAALANGSIAGAGLDVFEQEPPETNNPLFALPNVVLSPHFAGGTLESQYARFRNAFDNVRRVARGRAPLWLIPELVG
ncbi:MAG: 2-hydroxyacid dehydrogenase [Rhodospirillales bacterium]|nr:2-hydroxyacid dehydrogenase [Rhodospirillales bacterium]